MAEIKDYIVRSPVKHDGKRYEIGNTVPLTEALAEPLLKEGVIGEYKEPTPAPAAPADDAERLAAVKAAIGQLDKAVAAAWTAGGAPKTEALAKLTGWPVTAADRDAAWADLNKAAE